MNAVLTRVELKKGEMLDRNENRREMWPRKRERGEKGEIRHIQTYAQNYLCLSKHRENNI